MTSFWDFSPKGIPHRKAGNLLIAFYAPILGDSWDRLFISKRPSGVTMKRQSKILPLEKGMQVLRLGKKWRLTTEEDELLEKVNWWLKRNIKSDIIYRKDFSEKPRRKENEKKKG